MAIGNDLAAERGGGIAVTRRKIDLPETPRRERKTRSERRIRRGRRTRRGRRREIKTEIRRGVETEALVKIR